MSRRTKALSVSSKVKQRIRERDNNCCIFCGKYVPQGDTMHYISRGAGGRGIEENLALGCRECHMLLDQSTERKKMKLVFKTYLMMLYPHWREENLIYRKEADYGN